MFPQDSYTINLLKPLVKVQRVSQHLPNKIFDNTNREMDYDYD